jgi:hypothetical protein
MPRLSGRLALAVCALGLLGCVNGEASEAPLGGSDAAGSTAGGGASQEQPLGVGSGGAQTAGGAAATSGAGGAGAASCTSFADDAGWSLVVHIKNDKSSTIYVGQEMPSCDAQPLFQVKDGSGALLPSLSGCRSSCSAVMTSGPVTCPTVCAVPSTVTLAPGQTIDIPWNGMFGAPQTLPQECLRDATQGSASCVRAQQVKAGIYTFTAQAGSQLSCSQPGSCTCTPSSSGGCTTPASTISGTITTTEFTIALEPGEKVGPAGDYQYLGLTFKP